MDFVNRRSFATTTEQSGSVAGEFDRSSLTNVVPVILSGGGGSRLWPYSTADRPKQFLPLVGEKTLFREALDRVRDRTQFAAPIVVGNHKHAKFCEEELEREGDEARLILEPCARNTAPAIVMAASVVMTMYEPDALMLVMPSDHVIENVPAFHEAICKAELVARNGSLVTFGIRPTGPDTGYGYLQMGVEVEPGVHKVAQFVEKPSFEVAENMVAAGQHLWNAGIFLFRAGTLLEEAERVAPTISRSGQDAIRTSKRDGIRITPNLEILTNCPSESIDYAVMEHATNVAVVPMSPGWSDLGSWDALADMVAASASIEGQITMVDCSDCYIRTDGLEVAALGLRDLIVVASGQRLLILPRGRSQEVKRLLAAMEPGSVG
jgi:mannose-1-phosphate guanylyltransferase/mannose-1-phosphate guanylyltransferase/mannose-6-phosphate isomerase